MWYLIRIYMFRAQSAVSQCLTFATLLYQSTSYFGCRLSCIYSINPVALDVYSGNTQCWFSQSLVLNESKWSGGNIKVCLLLEFCFASLLSNIYREKRYISSFAGDISWERFVLHMIFRCVYIDMIPHPCHKSLRPNDAYMRQWSNQHWSR